MPSKAAEAPAIPTPELAAGQRPSAAGRRGRLGAGLVVLALVAILLSSPLAAAGTFPVSVEQVAVGTTDGPAGAQAEDGIRESMREADVAPDPLAYPALQNLSEGSQVSGAFPADVRISDGVYVRYREATPGPVTVSSNPTSVKPGCTWTACGNGMASDNSYATSSAGGDAAEYAGFSFSVPAAATITRVEVGYEAFAAGNDRIAITLSWDGGATWCPTVTSGLPGGDPNAYTFSSFTACTGHTWTPSDFGANLSARFTHNVQGGSPETIDLDANVVRVTYQPLAYALALEYDWTGVASGQRHDVRISAHISDENVSVEVLTPPSLWTQRLIVTDTTDKVLTYALAASEFDAGNVSVRFVDALGPDVAPSDLWIDYVDVVTTAVAYRLDVSQTVTGIGGADPTLDIEGNISAGGENFDVFAWNFTAGAWGLKMASVFTAVNEMHRVALLPDEILNGTVRIDFRDRDPASAVPATLTLELVQVSTTDPASGLSSIVLLGGGVIAGIAAAAAFLFFVVLPRRKSSSDDAEAAPEPPRSSRLPSLGGLLAKGGPAPPDPAIAVGDLRPGGAYLVDEKKPAAAMRALEHVTRMGRSGFLITRRNESDVQRTFKLRHTKIVSLSDNRDSGSGLVLAASLDGMATDTGDFLRTNPVGVVLIDCLKELVESNDFPSVLQFLRRVVEQVSAGQQILLVSMPPGILRGRELKQLAQQFEVVRIT